MYGCMDTWMPGCMDRKNKNNMYLFFTLAKYTLVPQNKSLSSLPPQDTPAYRALCPCHVFPPAQAYIPHWLLNVALSIWKSRVSLGPNSTFLSLLWIASKTCLSHTGAPLGAQAGWTQDKDGIVPAQIWLLAAPRPSYPTLPTIYPAGIFSDLDLQRLPLCKPFHKLVHTVLLSEEHGTS